MSSSSRKMLQAAAGNAGGGDFYPYTIDNSCRFDGSSAYMRRVFSTPSDSKKYTLSVWVKKGTYGYGQILTAYPSSGVFSGLNFSDDEQRITEVNPANTQAIYLDSVAKYRDQSAWYHLLFSVDTTQATASNRVRFFVNGIQTTDFVSPTNQQPSQNYNNLIGSAIAHLIGAFPTLGAGSAGSNYFYGYMAEYIFFLTEICWFFSLTI